MLKCERTLACFAGLALSVSALRAQVPLPPVAGPEAVAGSPVVVVPVADSPRGSGLDAGGSLYLLKPYIQNNTAFTVTSANAVVDGITTTSSSGTISRDFGSDLTPAFAFWLGATGPSGVGGRARYFHFDHSPSTLPLSLSSGETFTGGGTIVGVNPAPGLTSPALLFPNLPSQAVLAPSALLNFITAGTGAGADTLAFSSSLRIDAIDAEATYAWTSGSWSVIGGAGGRYLRLKQDYQATLSNAGEGVGASQFASFGSSRTFEGGGPTASAQVTYRLGGSGLGLFASGRGAIVVGQTNQITTFNNTLNDPTGVVTGAPSISVTNNRVPNNSNDTITVGELEVGVQYDLSAYDAVWFVRAAGVAQTYLGAGSSTQGGGDLSLLGCQFSLGVNY